MDLAEPSGIHAGWGIKINSRFEAKRPPGLDGPPTGGRAATLTPLSPFYHIYPTPGYDTRSSFFLSGV